MPIYSLLKHGRGKETDGSVFFSASDFLKILQNPYENEAF